MARDSVNTLLKEFARNVILVKDVARQVDAP